MDRLKNKVAIVTEVCPAKWKPGSATLKPSLELVGTL